MKTKLFRPQPIFPYKSSQEFSKKSECDNILSNWKITFQASDIKGQYFLKLYNEDNKLLEPIYTKEKSQLKYLGHSNFLCARATRTIVNHVLIGKYRLRFFLRKDFSCSCGEYPIKTKYYILHKYRRFNMYWNLRRDFISHFIPFFLV